jgi:hypothetical protein
MLTTSRCMLPPSPRRPTLDRHHHSTGVRRRLQSSPIPVRKKRPHAVKAGSADLVHPRPLSLEGVTAKADDPTSGSAQRLLGPVASRARPQRRAHKQVSTSAMPPARPSSHSPSSSTTSLRPLADEDASTFGVSGPRRPRCSTTTTPTLGQRTRKPRLGAVITELASASTRTPVDRPSPPIRSAEPPADPGRAADHATTPGIHPHRSRRRFQGSIRGHQDGPGVEPHRRHRKRGAGAPKPPSRPRGASPARRRRSPR